MLNNDAKQIDQVLLQKYADAFIAYEIDTHNVDPRETLDGTIMRIKNEEGYKKDIYKKVRGDLFTSDSYSEVMIRSLSGGNLVNHHQVHKIVSELEEKGTEDFEYALERLYNGNDEKLAFDEIVNVVGAYFDVVGFLFFLKDCDRFLPIRSSLFDKRLSLLGLQSELTGNCSWEKYCQFNAWIDAIKRYLVAKINSDITLLDAHSFVWFLPKLEEYLNNSKGKRVEHRMHGEGVVVADNGKTITIQFANGTKKFNKNIVFKNELITYLEDEKDKDNKQEHRVPPNNYIVFQGSHHEKEYEDGYLFAPLFDEKGQAPHHWLRLTELKKGDKVFHYCRGFIRAISTVTSPWVESTRPDSLWDGKGRLVKCVPWVLEPPLDISDYTDDISKYKKNKYSAFNDSGRANRGYLFELEPEIAALFETAAETRKQTQVLLSKIEDEELISNLQNFNMSEVEEGFEYKGERKEKPAPKYTNGYKVYPRDRQTAINALSHAHFKCEVDENHPTFIGKSSSKPYTEPHHLVPMSFSDAFEVSLDTEENIVSLCSNCHNEIHYGRDARVLIEKLYTNRKELLNSVGISITLEELLNMYGI